MLTFSGTISGIITNVKGNTPQCKLNAAIAIKMIGNELLVSAVTPKTTNIIWVIVTPAKDATSKYCRKSC